MIKGQVKCKSLAIPPGGENRPIIKAWGKIF